MKCLVIVTLLFFAAPLFAEKYIYACFRIIQRVVKKNRFYDETVSEPFSGPLTAEEKEHNEQLLEKAMGQGYTVKYLANGEQAYIWAVTNNTTGEKFVLKIGKFSGGKEKLALDSLAKIDHPGKNHLPTLKQLTNSQTKALREADIDYTALELIRGIGLDKLAAKRGYRLSKEEADLIKRDVNLALDALHKCNIAHTDIRADNIMVETDSSGKVTKAILIDLARTGSLANENRVESMAADRTALKTAIEEEAQK